jgi:hypothetical protein
LGTILLVVEEREAEREGLLERIPAHAVTAVFCPSGAGAGALVGDAARQTHFRRRFMQLGGTLAGMQVWEVRRAVQALRSIPALRDAAVELHASKAMTEVACFAALFEPAVRSVSIACPPRHDKEAPDFLNWSRILTPGQLLELTRQKCRVEVRPSAAEAAEAADGGGK